MIRKWAKILPYWIIMRVVKRYGPEQIMFNDQKSYAFRIDKGEWIVWNEKNYKILNKKRQKKQELKKEKRRWKYEKLKTEFEE